MAAAPNVFEVLRQGHQDEVENDAKKEEGRAAGQQRPGPADSPRALKGREGLVLLEANALVTRGVTGKEEAGSAHHHADAANDVEDAAGPVQAQASVKAAGQKGKEEGEDG